MPAAPEVTIIVPTFNREGLLPRLFRSLEAVDWDRLEVILADNGSTDSSLALCRDYAQRSRPTALVVQEPAKGANRARNRGLELARGEWVHFFDSDDELSPDFLRTLMPLAKADTDLIAFPTRQESGGRVRTRGYVPSPSVASQILSGTINTQGAIWRTAFLRAIGGWNESLTVWQDWELAVRALAHSPRIAWHTGKPLHLIHLSAHSITGGASSSDRLNTMAATLPLLSTASQRRALYLRSRLWEGKAHENLSLPLRQPLPTRLLGSLLSLYSRIGLRGAWRIALAFCR